MAQFNNYIPEPSIEAAALTLIGEYGRKFGEILEPPIPAEEIIDSHLGLDFRFGDLPAEQKDPRALGATWFRERRVKIDQSLDPSEYPSKLGRYRFTVAHEIGHWELHRHLYLSGEGQGVLLTSKDEPIVCRSNDKNALEWQADRFAGYLLMPKDMVYAQWEALHGNREPYFAIDEILDLKARFGLGEDDRPSVAVARQMAQIFQVSAQAMQIRLIDLKLVRVRPSEPRLFS